VGFWVPPSLPSPQFPKLLPLRLPVSVDLIALAMAVALLIAIPAGIIAALRQNTWADYTAVTSALAGISIPDFFLGILLLLVFSFALQGLLPSSGWMYWPGTCPSLVGSASMLPLLSSTCRHISAILILTS